MGTGKTAMVHKVATALKPLLTSMSTPRPDPKNVRKHSQANIDAIAASMEKFTQRTPIVVNRNNGYILKGNGTYAAAKQLGWTHLAVVFVLDSDDEAMAYAIADNRTAELAEWDWEALQGQFKTLIEHGEQDLLTSTGWAEDELSMYVDGAFKPAQRGDMPDTPNPPAAMLVKFEGEDQVDVVRRLTELYDAEPREALLACAMDRLADA